MGGRREEGRRWRGGREEEEERWEEERRGTRRRIMEPFPIGKCFTLL